jgi:hypothetical protein
MIEGSCRRTRDGDPGLRFLLLDANLGRRLLALISDLRLGHGWKNRPGVR